MISRTIPPSSERFTIFWVGNLRSGRREIVLPIEGLAAAPIHVVFPHRRLAAAKVRVFVGFLALKLKSAQTPN
ncbi:hypothetical protein A6U87_20860 [Rhizobium sp. AC44/96]|nr:hypothetical protein A6U87_20860 [Rhizobium sp. AC44/96]